MSPFFVPPWFRPSGDQPHPQNVVKAKVEDDSPETLIAVHCIKHGIPCDHLPFTCENELTQTVLQALSRLRLALTEY